MDAIRRHRMGIILAFVGFMVIVVWSEGICSDIVALVWMLLLC